jgi:hypothetical protein
MYADHRYIVLRTSACPYPGILPLVGEERVREGVFVMAMSITCSYVCTYSVIHGYTLCVRAGLPETDRQAALSDLCRTPRLRSHLAVYLCL